MAQVVLFGTTITSQLYHHFLTHDSPHEVVAFTVNEAYIRETTFLGLPVVAFEQVEGRFPPDRYRMAIPLGFHGVNRLRADRMDDARAKGYGFISHVSSKATVWSDLTVGENTFIHEGVVIQPFASLGAGVIVGPGALIGHHSTIGDCCFIGPRCAVLGLATVGARAVLGGNATIRDGLTVGVGAIVGAGALVTRDVPEASVQLATPAERLPGTSDEFAALLEAAG